jgi:hypothetical protein
LRARRKAEGSNRGRKKVFLMTIDYLCLRITFFGIKHISHESFEMVGGRTIEKRKNISGNFVFGGGRRRRQSGAAQKKARSEH